MRLVLISAFSIRLIPDEAKTVIDAFLQQDHEERLAVYAPEADAYEPPSAEVIETHEKLVDDFIAERCRLVPNFTFNF